MAKIEIRSIDVRFVPGFFGAPQTGDKFFTDGQVWIGNTWVPFKNVQLTQTETDEMQTLFNTIAKRLDGVKPTDLT